MDRVMPVMRMTTTTESLTIGTTAAWCPTQGRKTQIVRQGVGPVVGQGVWSHWGRFSNGRGGASGRCGRGHPLEWAGLGVKRGAWH